MRVFILLTCLAVALGNPTLFPSGRSVKQSRIVGGRAAAPGELPYQVAIRYYGSDNYACSGSILTPTWVLTAAQCCLSRSDIYVYTGSVSLSSGGVNTEIYDDHKHPGFTPDYHLQNDICLIHLANKLALNANTQQVSLPPEGWELPDNSKVVVSGWGFTTSVTETQEIPDNLQVVTNYNSISGERCHAINNGVPFYDGLVCAIGENQGTCDYDYGAPLVFNGAQVGVLSFMTWPCAVEGGPSFYVRVANYNSWIKSILGPDASLLKYAKAADL